MEPRLRLAATALAMTAILAACSDSDPTGTDAPPGFGTPSIDGVVDVAEWANAVTYDDVFGMESGLEGSTLLILNDEENLYFAVRTTDPTLDDADLFEVRFDTSDDGVYSDGDDRISVRGGSGFGDSHLASGNYAGDAQSHGAGAISQVGGAVHAELSHPLSSGDAQDIAFTPGQSISFCVRYLPSTGGSGNAAFPVECILTVFPQSDFERIQLASP